MYRLSRALNSSNAHTLKSVLMNPKPLTNVFPIMRIPNTQFRSISNDDNCSNDRKLPDELAKYVVNLSCKSSADTGVCNVYVVGTYHTLKKYHVLAREVVRFLKPRAVFLEVSRERGVDMIKSRDSGSEFLVAYEEAKRYGGKVIFGDLPANILYRRMWDKFSPSKLVSWLSYVSSLSEDTLDSLESSIKRVKDVDNVDLDGIAIMNQELGKLCPTLTESFLHERDRYMSSRLLEVSSMHNSVVAVVGMAHLPGIMMHWKQSIQAREFSDTSGQKPADPVS